MQQILDSKKSLRFTHLNPVLENNTVKSNTLVVTLYKLAYMNENKVFDHWQWVKFKNVYMEPYWETQFLWDWTI